MPRKIFERLPPERQREIVSIAAQEFAKSGFQGTSYNRLLARVGLGKGSAYYYFEDKQDLFLTVVRACYRTFFEGLPDLATPEDPEAYWGFVEAITLRGLEFFRTDPTSAMLLRCFARESSTLSVLSSHQVFQEVERYYVELVQKGQEVGAIRRDLPLSLLTDLSRALSGVFDQWFIANASDGTPRRLRGLARTFTELTRRLLEPLEQEPKRRGKPSATGPGARS